MKDSKSGKSRKSASAILVGIIGGIIVITIFVVGTIVMGGSAHKDTENAVSSVSDFYLDELAGHRDHGAPSC